MITLDPNSNVIYRVVDENGEVVAGPYEKSGTAKGQVAYNNKFRHPHKHHVEEAYLSPWRDAQLV